MIMMTNKRALQALAAAGFSSWLVLSGCGMGGSGCGGATPGASVPPNCAQGTYAKQNSDGSYGACQPIPQPKPAGGSSSSSGP